MWHQVLLNLFVISHMKAIWIVQNVKRGCFAKPVDQGVL